METHQLTQLSKLTRTTGFKAVTVKPLDIIFITLSRDLVKNLQCNLCITQFGMLTTLRRTVKGFDNSTEMNKFLPGQARERED